MASPALGLRKGFVPNSANIDWAHPLSSRLEFCGVPSLGLDLAKMRPAILTATSGQTHGSKPDRYGPSLIANWSNADTTDLAFTSGPWTLAVVTHLYGGGAFYDTFRRHVYVGESNNQGWGIQINTTAPPGASFLSFRNNSAANWRCSQNQTIPFRSYVHIARSNGSNLRELFANGLRVAFVSTNVNPVDSAGSLILGNADVTSSIGFAWSRSLSNNDIALLTADPFCILRY